MPRSVHRNLEAVSKDPNEPTLWGFLGQACLEAGAPRSAAVAFRNFLALDPQSAEGAASLGVALIALKQFAKAEHALRAALTGDPELLPAWQNLGNCLFFRGEYEEALACFNRTVELRPDYSLGWWGKGHVLTKLGRQDEAERCLKRVIKLDSRLVLDMTIPRPNSGAFFFGSSVTLDFLKERARRSKEEE